MQLVPYAATLLIPQVVDFLPDAAIVDIDGTLAIHEGRGPFDWHRVIEDRPNFPVIHLVRILHAAGIKVILCSGRMELCRDETVQWLQLHRIPFDVLVMRSNEKQYVPDNEIKEEMYKEHIAERYRVLFVIDDRNRVVAMWRGLGLTVLQCADGDF